MHPIRSETRKTAMTQPAPVSPAPMPRRRKAVRRSEILAAARQVFSAKAFASASVSEIAARAGCVEGTIYTYFRNKRDLFDAVLEEFYDRLIEDIGPGFEAIDDTRERLAFLIARHLRIPIDDPGMGRIIVREARMEEAYFGSKLHALNRRYSRFLLRTLSDGIERGELRADLDVALARDMLFGGLSHVIWSQMDRGRAFDPQAIAQALVQMMMQGWQASQAAAAVQPGQYNRADDGPCT